jgi:hypothetical protein
VLAGVWLVQAAKEEVLIAGVDEGASRRHEGAVRNKTRGSEMSRDAMMRANQVDAVCNR